MDDEQVDGLVNAIRLVAKAVTPTGAEGHDATGGTITSLTEAAMGITAALVQVADSIRELADAVREAHPPQ